MYSSTNPSKSRNASLPPNISEEKEAFLDRLGVKIEDMLVRVVVHKIDKVTEAFESRIRSLDEYMEELEKYMIASNENSMARFYNFSYCRRKEDQLEPLRSLKTSEIIPELENMTSGGLYNLRSEQLDSILDALTIKDVPDNDNLKRRRIRLACGIVFQDVRELLG